VAEEKMDVHAVLECLNRALPLVRRSVLGFSLAAGSGTGPLGIALAEPYAGAAAAELRDEIRLVQEIVALGGEPSTDVGRFEWSADPRRAAERLVAWEEETMEALRAVVEPAGDEAPGEALEHLIEHLILRKQEQLNLLRRALDGD
jgi:hypothetical protein